MKNKKEKKKSEVERIIYIYTYYIHVYRENFKGWGEGEVLQSDCNEEELKENLLEETENYNSSVKFGKAKVMD